MPEQAPAARAGPDPEVEASRQLLLEMRREQSSLRSLVEQQAAAMQQLATLATSMAGVEVCEPHTCR